MSQQPTVAIVPWGNVLEDFLKKIGVSLETFCTEFTGSWMFGYVDALHQAGVRTVLICISDQIAGPSRFTHRPTGATVCVLPVPKAYRALRRGMANPYGRTIAQMFGNIPRAIRLPLAAPLAILKEIALYLTTPLSLVARELRREGCIAVLCQEYEYPRFDLCVALGRMMHMPVFATFQGGNYQRSWIERYLRPLALRASTGLIIATETEAQRIRQHYGLGDEKLVRIFNPINLDLWKSVDRRVARAVLHIPLDAQVVVWHGRVSIQQKGLDVLLEAWEKICSQRPGRKLSLLLVGTGKDADALRDRITSMKLQNVLWVNEFVHDRNVIRQYLSAADVYAFPSRHEGFPVSPLEAMACGLPVVAADAPGIPDIFDEGAASGGLVVPHNNPGELAFAIGRILDDETWGHELGKRARRRVETQFSLGAVGQQLRAFLFENRSNIDPTTC